MSTSTTPAKKYKAKTFRVAVEGATTDGRNIERAWLTEMAASYNPTTYGARVWMEHLRGTYADSAFRAYGDVTALSAQEVEINGQKKLALFATIEPTADLVLMTTKAKQKIYTSIEVTPKFADTGKAYLTGLAVTDTPASLGTEVLSFAAQNPGANPFAARKSHADALFSAGAEVDGGMSFEEDAPSAPSAFTKALDGVKALFAGKTASDDTRFAAVLDALQAAGSAHTALTAELTGLRADFSAAKAELEKTKTDLASLTAKLDTTDRTHHTQRPTATGGNGATLAQF